MRTQVARSLNAPVASSAGRLFDAAAALLGIRDVAEFEAQAAIDLELAAGDRVRHAAPVPARPRRTACSSTTRGPRWRRSLEARRRRPGSGPARGRVPGHGRTR